MKPKWICTAPEVETPVFSRTVWCDGISHAEIDICGLGWFTLLVNGKQINDTLFVPAQTNYAWRDLRGFAYGLTDRMSYRAHYLTYDLTPYLQKGENRMEVILGNGWFRQKERVCEGETMYAPALVLWYELRITEADGAQKTVRSDGSERCHVYPILESNIYLGETVDTRLFDEPLTETPVTVTDFFSPLVKQTCPPDRVIRTITPTLLKREGDLRTYDAGENITGIVSLRIKGERGEQVRLEFAESMKDGKLRFETMGSDYRCKSGRPQIQGDTFILNGSEQTLAPMFVFHGFRYFTLSCATNDVLPTVQVIHTDAPVASRFDCDDEVLNWLYEAYLRSQLDNLHGCIPSDCPHRERLGYTGDGQACAEAAMLTLDAHGVYTKWLRDILDSQDRQTGHVKHTAPCMGGGGGPGGWGCAIAILPDRMYDRYADMDAVRASYDPILHWIDYMDAKSEDSIVVREEPNGWCLGDWCTPEPIAIPEAFVNTCYLIHTLQIAAKFSDLLGRGDAPALLARAEESREALALRYYDGSDYCGGIQGANAYAVWARLPHYETLPARLAEHYRALGRLDTGFLGTDILCAVLFETGYGDVAIDLLASRDEKIGFAMMMRAGATTLYEYIETDRHSRNHPMFGACVRNLFTGLLGIRNREGCAGYTDLVISPCLHSRVKRASGSVRAGEGEVSLSFSVTDERTQIEVDLPRGVKAVLRIGDREWQLKPGRQTVTL